MILSKILEKFDLSTRCFETGIYKGFMKTSHRKMFVEVISFHKIMQIDIVYIYNEWNIHAAHHQRTESIKNKG